MRSDAACWFLSALTIVVSARRPQIPRATLGTPEKAELPNSLARG
jgi:hypothetical protein